MKQILTILLAVFISTSFAQDGVVGGTVRDSNSQEALPFAKITLEVNSVVKYGTVSDFDGRFKITGIKPGQYLLRIRMIGFEEMQENIIIKPAETLNINSALIDNVPCTCQRDPIQFIVIHQYDKDREVGAPMK